MFKKKIFNKPKFFLKEIFVLNKIFKSKSPKFFTALQKKNYLKKKFLKKKFKRYRKRRKKLNFTLKVFCLSKNNFFFNLRQSFIKKKLKNKFFQSIFLLKKLTSLHLDASGLKIKKLPNIIKADIINHKKKKLKFILTLTVHSNNIFLNLALYLKRKIKTVKFWSAGLFDFVCSKKKIKFAITAFLKEIKKQIIRLRVYIIKIYAPKHLNRYIFKQFIKFFYHTKLYIYTSFRIFNGCRSPKKRRKKRLRFRFFR